MKQLAMLAVVLGLGFTLGAADAEAARRFGGARSSGMQRQLPPQNTATPMPAPTSPAAATTAAKSQAANSAAAPQKRSWMGPIAGLAAGLGLAALASHFGFGEELASMMMMALLVMAVMMVIGFVMRRRAGTQAASQGMQYAAAGAPQSARPFDMALPASPAPASANVAADFDMEGFLRSAKVLFIRLQAANDTANLADIREFTTPEMFAEVRMEIAERGELEQCTDVLTVDAQLIEHVAEDEREDEREIASVRFSATMREGGDGAVESVDEVWHLVLPKGRHNWCLAGIQQLQ